MYGIHSLRVMKFTGRIIWCGWITVQSQHRRPRGPGAWTRVGRNWTDATHLPAYRWNRTGKWPNLEKYGVTTLYINIDVTRKFYTIDKHVTQTVFPKRPGRTRLKPRYKEMGPDTFRRAIGLVFEKHWGHSPTFGFPGRAHCKKHFTTFQNLTMERTRVEKRNSQNYYAMKM